MTIESSRQLLTAEDRLSDRAERAFKESVSTALPNQFSVIVYVDYENPEGNQSMQNDTSTGFGWCRVRSKAGHHDMLQDPATIKNKTRRLAEINAHHSAYYSLFGENMPQNGDVWSAEMEGATIRLISLLQRNEAFRFLKDDEKGGEANNAFKTAPKSSVGEMVSKEKYPPPQEMEYVGKEARFKGTKFHNGAVPRELLRVGTKGYAGARPTLIVDVVDSYDSLCEAFAKEFKGYQLGAYSSIRTYEEQIAMKEKWTERGKPKNAATPGTSKHGWGLAFDAGYWKDGVSSRLRLTFDSKQFKWLASNVGRFGFTHPRWAQQGEKNEEPWHFEWSNPKEVIK